MKTDSLFYRLFQELPGLVFELAEWPVPTGAVYTLRAEEVKQTSFRLDGLLLPPPGLPDLPGIFVETQFQLDNDFYSRWFTQIFLFLYRRRWQGPWRAVVIFPSRKVDPQPPVAYQPLLDSPWVKRVYLEDLQERTNLTPGLQLMQLIVAEPEVAVSQAQALLTVRGGPAVDPDWRGWLDLIETVVVYKLPHLSREEIQRMLHLPEVELKQTRFYQDVFAEGHAEGRTEGRVEGRTEGRAEGQQQGEAALVLRLLRRRLGTVSAEVENRIRALPVAELETLGEALLDWHTPAELMAWFQRRG
jgi:predicted transposase/invertase (TIGR01784 family)